MKQIFATVLSLLWFMTASAATDLTSRENDLFESLMDLSALTRSGIEGSEFSKRIPDLTIKYDRFIRAGGDKYGYLYEAYSAYKDAANFSEAQARSRRDSADFPPETKFKLEQLGSRSLQLKLERAQNSLESYKREKEDSSARKGARTGDRASRKGPSRESEADAIIRDLREKRRAFNANSEALDEKYDAQKRELESRRACLYTNPPSCR